MSSVTTWTTSKIDGKDYLIIEVAQLRVPLEWDPSSSVFIAVAAGAGGLFNYPALAQGDDGATPDIDSNINFTPLAPDDATPDFASWTEISPNVYRLNLGLHTGQDGADGGNIIIPSDYGTPAAGRILRIKSDLTGFELIAPKVGDRFYPATFANVPTGNAAYTVVPIAVPAQPFDWRPTVEGFHLITGTGADVKVDLLARLSTAGISNGETTGPIVARATQRAGQYPPTHVLSSAIPAGSAATYDKVLEGNTAVIYIRMERVTGAETFSALAVDGAYSVRVNPIP